MVNGSRSVAQLCFANFYDFFKGEGLSGRGYVVIEGKRRGRVSDLQFKRGGRVQWWGWGNAGGGGEVGNWESWVC
jgi:hypothetical protein